jgi:hypothetical protein
VLTGTRLYAGEGEWQGRRVHVLAYQNMARSLVMGPNAMILPFPALEAMDERNVIDTRTFSAFLENITDPLQGARSRSMSKSIPEVDSVRVFDVGSYTVVLASQGIADAAKALHRVSVEKRPPPFRDGFVEGYQRLYGSSPVAICCWAGTVQAEPLLWWYVPRSYDTFFAPAVDAHDGNAPDPNAMVSVDHYVAFGSSAPLYGEGGEELGVGMRVGYTQGHEIASAGVKSLLPLRIRGRKFQRQMPNGDFYLPREALFSRGNIGITRSCPGGTTVQESLAL